MTTLREALGYAHALLGSDTKEEAAAVWEQNPEARREAHAVIAAYLSTVSDEVEREPLYPASTLTALAAENAALREELGKVRSNVAAEVAVIIPSDRGEPGSYWAGYRNGLIDAAKIARLDPATVNALCDLALEATHPRQDKGDHR